MLGRLAFRIDLHTCLAADVFVPVQLRLERKKRLVRRVDSTNRAPFRGAVQPTTLLDLLLFFALLRWRVLLRLLQLALELRHVGAEQVKVLKMVLLRRFTKRNPGKLADRISGRTP